MGVSETVMVRICGIGLTTFLAFALTAKAAPSTGHLQTYVSKSGSINLRPERYSDFFFTQQTEDSIEAGSVDSIKLKEPSMALFYAVIPGIIIHGSGHFYAGETTTGWILVGGEVLSLCLLTYAVGVGIGESTNGSTSNGGAEIVSIFAGGLFVGSWIYDVIKSPLIVEKENRLLEKSRTNLNMQMDNRTTKLVITHSF